jgi:hypothetical protein
VIVDSASVIASGDSRSTASWPSTTTVASSPRRPAEASARAPFAAAAVEEHQRVSCAQAQHAQRVVRRCVRQRDRRACLERDVGDVEARRHGATKS